MAGRKIYRTMQGREIDMDALLEKNELMPAVGNVRVNARGDELGPGGVVVKKREEVIAAYYENNPNAMPDPQFPPKVAQQVKEQKAQAKKAPNKTQGE